MELLTTAHRVMAIVLEVNWHADMTNIEANTVAFFFIPSGTYPYTSGECALPDLSRSMSNDTPVAVKAAVKTDTTMENIAAEEWLEPVRKAYVWMMAPGIASAKSSKLLVKTI